MGDKLIRQNVIDELDFDPSIDAAHIGVAVENGIVTLTGHVASYTARVAAEKSAQKVRGVRGVVDGWVTLSGTVDWQYQKEEAYRSIERLAGVTGILNTIAVARQASAPDVRAKILAALKRNAELEADAITVTVKDTKVVLEGKVNAWHERQLVENAAWSAPGVRAVEDHLTLG